MKKTRTEEFVRAPSDPESDSTSAARPIRKRNPEESKRRILDAAEHAFARRGYEGARLRDIASEAGVHHALVHHYYGDKRGLFKEVLERALATVSTAGVASLSNATDLESSTQLLVFALYEFLATRRDLLHIIASAYRDRDGVAHELTVASVGTLAAPLLSHVRERILLGQERGLVRNDMSADELIVFGFSLIAYPFVTGSGLMVSLGVPKASEEQLAARKSQLVKYIVGAMRPQ